MSQNMSVKGSILFFLFLLMLLWTLHCINCIGFSWLASGVGWGYKVGAVASVRRCQKLSQCLTEPMPAGLRMDPLLAKSESVRNENNASVTTQLRRNKVLLHKCNCGQRRE